MVGMDEQISRLMDDEMDEEDVDRLLAVLRQHGAPPAWDTYHLIGDAMRELAPVPSAFMERFGARLAAEPTVLAPRPRTRYKPRAIALSAAASVAAVGLVVWAVMQTHVADFPENPVVANAPQSGFENVNPYLLAHQEHSPSVAMQGMATYIRTVSESSKVAAR